MKNLSSALVKAQQGFAPALKTSINPHFRSKYADLSACVEAVIDSLNANGIALVQQSHECNNGVIVETTFLHESGESLSCGKLYVPAIKNDAQGYGSALTYARRYSLMAACGIAPEDDDGNAASKAPQPTAHPSVSKDVWVGMSADEKTFLQDIANETIRMLNQDNATGAVAHIDSQRLDADEKTALWSRFDSKQRSALKKAASLSQLKEAA